ncbi:MAG: redox-sensing transcriptional repressor Rex [Defluviitaleaceae bacterium]|nr:redox-sensing transcriptional repressor Rex [Defluviitaleaceae bacterium]
MPKEKKISMAVIRRLPRYHRYLGDLLDKDINRISSEELSIRMGITSSQIRQDLNNFGAFGQQGYGYNVSNLYEVISKILGLDREYSLIAIGAGNVCRALVNYENFTKRRFIFKAIFDSSHRLVDERINGIKIQNIEHLQRYLRSNKVDIAALTLPGPAALRIAPILANSDVRGIWNFTQEDLHLPDNVIVENVPLTDSLMTLSYKINEDLILARLRD